MIKVNSLVKLVSGNVDELTKIYQRLSGAPGPLGHTFFYGFENQLFIVRRVSGNGTNITCECLYQNTSNRNNATIETLNIHSDYLEVVLEDVYNKESLVALSPNIEYKFDNPEVIYPTNERIPHEILNEDDIEELQKVFTYEELKNNLIRALYALNAAEERVKPIKKEEIKNESRKTSGGNNNKKSNVGLRQQLAKVVEPPEVLDLISGEESITPVPPQRPTSRPAGFELVEKYLSPYSGKVNSNKEYKWFTTDDPR